MSIYKIGFDTFEIIVVDDNSTDNTRQKIEKLKEKYEEIHLYVTPKSKGYAGQPRNIGISHAKGEYIAFMDPDDYYFGTGMKMAFDLYSGYDYIVNSYAWILDEGNGDFTNSFTTVNKPCHYRENYLKNFNGVAAQRMLISNAFIKENNLLYNEDLPMQDTMFLIDAMNCKPSIMCTDILTSCYRVNRATSVTNTYTSKKLINGLTAIDVIINKVNESVFYDAVKEELVNALSNWYFKKIIDVVNEEQFELLKEYPYYKKLLEEINV